jgi:hypothetical protein
LFACENELLYRFRLEVAGGNLESVQVLME